MQSSLQAKGCSSWSEEEEEEERELSVQSLTLSLSWHHLCYRCPPTSKVGALGWWAPQEDVLPWEGLGSGAWYLPWDPTTGKHGNKSVGYHAL